MERYIANICYDKKLPMTAGGKAWPSGYPLSDKCRKIFDMLITCIMFTVLCNLMFIFTGV